MGYDMVSAGQLQHNHEHHFHQFEHVFVDKPLSFSGALFPKCTIVGVLTSEARICHAWCASELGLGSPVPSGQIARFAFNSLATRLQHLSNDHFHHYAALVARIRSLQRSAGANRWEADPLLTLWALIP